MTYLWIGLAGALGAMLRYIIGLFLFTGSIFPWATLIINLIGSFVLAWLTSVLFKKVSISPMLASAIGTGFVGSFTTFSMVSVETVLLFEQGHLGLGIGYVLVSIMGGILMSRLGFNVSQEMERAA